MTSTVVVREGQIGTRIHMVRDQKVMLDSDLAALYGVAAKALNQAVRRNLDRFPSDFMFQLEAKEYEVLRSQSVTLNTSRGTHRKYLPYAFTEQGVAMLSSVLRSARAIQVNIEIMRAFVRIRELAVFHADIARKLEALERRCDRQFKVVFDAIRDLIAARDTPKRRIGFTQDAPHE